MKYKPSLFLFLTLLACIYGCKKSTNNDATAAISGTWAWSGTMTEPSAPDGLDLFEQMTISSVGNNKLLGLTGNTLSFQGYTGGQYTYSYSNQGYTPGSQMAEETLT